MDAPDAKLVILRADFLFQLQIHKHMKIKKIKNEKTITADEGEKIRQRAYEIWEACGCPHGEDAMHWLQAEREVKALRQDTKLT
jgi:hypothetical protein